MGASRVSRSSKKSMTSVHTSPRDLSLGNSPANQKQKGFEESSKVSSDRLSEAQREADGAISEEKLRMARLE